MFDPARDAEWTSGVTASRQLTEGPLRPGSIVERDVAFAGRTFTYRYEILRRDDNSLELSVDRPFPMAVTYRLDATGDGTRATIHARGDARGFFRFTGPLLDLIVRRNIRRDLRALKRIAESAV
jgi:hypothetical protein